MARGIRRNFPGATISAQINGVRVAAVTNHAYRYGPAGLGSLGYYPVLYPASRFASHPRLDLALVKTMFASSDRRAGPE
jgi:hypothetical protein